MKAFLTRFMLCGFGGALVLFATSEPRHRDVKTRDLHTSTLVGALGGCFITLGLTI